MTDCGRPVIGQALLKVRLRRVLEEQEASTDNCAVEVLSTMIMLFKKQLKFPTGWTFNAILTNSGPEMVSSTRMP